MPEGSNYILMYIFFNLDLKQLKVQFTSSLLLINFQMCTPLNEILIFNKFVFGRGGWKSSLCRVLWLCISSFFTNIDWTDWGSFLKNALYIIQLCTFQRTLWNVVLFVNYFSSFTAIQFCLTSWHLYYLIDKYFSLFVFPSQVFLDFTTTIAVFSGSKYKTDLVVFLL